MGYRVPQSFTADGGPTGYAIGFTPDPSQTIQEARTAQAIGPKPTERLDFPSEAT